MDEHDLVSNCVLVANDHEFLFKIRRTLAGSESEIIVHLTDAYRYGLAEFYTRPKQLRAGSYVVIGMPHAGAGDKVIEEAKKDSIGIGDIRKFMGALNFKEIWKYMTRKEREQKTEEQRRKKQRRGTS